MARWDQAAAPWLACAGLPLGVASWGALGDGGGACASPFVILSGAKDLLSSAGAAWGEDPSAALPPQDDKERRHWRLGMTGEGVLAPQDDGGKDIGVSG